MQDWTGNGNSIWKTLGATNHTNKDREENDFYATDPIAIDKLLSVEKPHTNIWECACGQGHLTNRLKENGFNVYSSDLIKRSEICDKTLDFLTALKTPYDNCDILTNPPYNKAKEFVLKALDLIKNGRKCYMFLKLTFLEGKARYDQLFSKYPPKNVYVFTKRITCAPNGEFDKTETSAVCYAWFVWEKGYTGKTEISWI